MDHALSTDPIHAEFGWLIVNRLASSSFATKDDVDMFQSVAERWLDWNNEESTAHGNGGGAS